MNTVCKVKLSNTYNIHFITVIECKQYIIVSQKGDVYDLNSCRPMCC